MASSPLVAPSNQESQIHDLVGKLLSGQGLPWLKSVGLKHLASHEKTRVMLLRLLELKLGVRTPNMFVMSTELYVLPKVSVSSMAVFMTDIFTCSCVCVLHLTTHAHHMTYHMTSHDINL